MQLACRLVVDCKVVQACPAASQLTTREEKLNGSLQLQECCGRLAAPTLKPGRPWRTTHLLVRAVEVLHVLGDNEVGGDVSSAAKPPLAGDVAPLLGLK